MARRRPLDRADGWSTSVDRVSAGPLIGDQRTCWLTVIITVGLARRGSIARVDRVEAGCTGDQSARDNNRGVITAEIKSRGSHLSRPIAIEGASFEAFSKALSADQSRPSIRDPTIATFSENGPSWTVIVTVDRFDRTVTIFRPIKGHVLHVLMHPSKNQSNWLSRHLPCLFLSSSSSSSSISASKEG